MTGPGLIQVIVPLNLAWNPVYRVPAGFSVEVGERVRVPVGAREYVAAVISTDAVSNLPESRIREVIGKEENLPRIGVKEFELWKFISDYYLCPEGDVFKMAYPAGKTKVEAVRSKRKKASAAGDASSDFAVLSDAQKTAASQILASFRKGKPVLLEGVTGSGKTEIYLSLAKDVLEAGKTVLYMVPEIALSRQLEMRLEKFFPDSVLTFHSAETVVHRREVAEAVRMDASEEKHSGHIILGTRSALFLPFSNLGLIIVDEEHDTSYKSDITPRYNGRDAAVMLSRIHSCPALLGSATPSLESLYNASVGIYGHVKLEQKYYLAEEADVEMIDTIAERRKNGMVGSISRKLIERLNGTLELGRQALVLRARRSYSPVLQCQDCGQILKCPHCNVSMSLHNDSRVHCHYCGYSAPFNAVCPSCGGVLQPLGAGTQKIEEELAALFPNARVARLDSDTTRVKGEEKKIIRSFSSGEIDILVGTQIVSKGFDFGGVSLVAVIAADSLLGQQDFRADERALQLMEQLRGRCGRRGEKGLFVIQTAQPSHPVYAGICSHGNKNSQDLLAERKIFGYPPYGRIVNIVLRDINEQRAGLQGRSLVSRLQMAGINAVGPYAPAVDKIADQYIRHIRIVLARDRNLASCKESIRNIVVSFETERKYTGHITIDVDPV